MCDEDNRKRAQMRMPRSAWYLWCGEPTADRPDPWTVVEVVDERLIGTEYAARRVLIDYEEVERQPERCQWLARFIRGMSDEHFAAEVEVGSLVLIRAPERP